MSGRFQSLSHRDREKVAGLLHRLVDAENVVRKERARHQVTPCWWHHFRRLNTMSAVEFTMCKLCRMKISRGKLLPPRLAALARTMQGKVREPTFRCLCNPRVPLRCSIRLLWGCEATLKSCSTARTHDAQWILPYLPLNKWFLAGQS